MSLSDKELKEIAYLARINIDENSFPSLKGELDEILGDGNVVTGARVVNNKTQEKHEISCTGVFIAIGHTPNTKVFIPWLSMDENGYIVNNPGSSKTNIDGVFVSGDAADHVYRQAVTAAGTGCMAALDAERYLAAKGLH